MGEGGLKNGDFARIVAYIARNAATWAGDALILPEGWDQPVDHGAALRFIRECRSRLDYLERLLSTPSPAGEEPR